MMKQALVVLVAAIFFDQAFGDDEKYTTKYDNIDVTDVIGNDRLLRSYINCLMDKGKCTPEANELKRVLSEALETDCQKCNDTQKNGVQKVIKYLIKNRKSWWEELQTKYDPDGKYWEKYKNRWQEEDN